jgi:uncharacterized cupin superfamily protein
MNVEVVMFNVFSPDWDQERETGEFANTPGTRPEATVRVARLNGRLGAQKLGASYYELAPGAAQSPIHAHHANEEMIVVLSGRPTIRTLDGTRQLEPGDVASCLTGLAGAHRLENHGDEPARVLMICTTVYPDVIEHLGVENESVVVVTSSPFENGAVDTTRSFTVNRGSH